MHNVSFNSEFLTKIRPWLVVLSAASFVFLINSVTNINVITPYLSANLHFTASEIGFLFACYYYTNIMFVFWAGIILDKTSAKKILIISFIVANCSILIFTITNSFALMALSRLALGIVGSFSMLNCFKLIKRWFPPGKITLVTGIATTYATLGGLFSQTPLILAVEKLGWQAGLLVNLWLGIFLGFIAVIFIQDFPPNMQQNNPQQIPNNQTTVWQSIKLTITNHQNWLVGFYTSLFILPGLFFNASWGIIYLQQAGNLTEMESSQVVTTSIIGTIVGLPLAGWLSDKFHTRKTILIGGTFFTIIILLIITYITKISLLAFMFLFFLFGLMGSSQVVIFPLVAGNNLPSLIGTATGFVAALTALGGAYMPFLGWIMDYSQQVDKNTTNYYPVMWVLISIVIIGLFITLFIKETPNCQQQK